MASAISQVEKLNGENYAVWSVQMKSLLVTLDYWHVIENLCSITATAEQKAAWMSDDKKALATITLCVKPSELLALKTCVSAKGAWLKLSEIYRAKGPARKVNLFKRLVRFQFQHNQSYSSQVNSFCTIAESLKEIDVSIPDDILSIMLLCSLPEDMDNFVVAIESRDDLPKVDSLKMKIFEEEERRKGKVSEGEQVVYALDNKKFKRQSTRKYWDKKNNNNIKCYGCGKRGHVRAQCKNSSNNSASSEVVFGSYGSNSSGNSKQWILDSGASSHICNNKGEFSSYREQPQKVILASGESVSAKGIGNVRIKSAHADIILTEVLFVPELTSNFLSVGKIICNGNSVKFTENKACAYTKRGNLIFVAEKSYGIFVAKFNQNEYAYMNCEKSNDFDLWHRRYGHLNARDLCALSSNEMVRGLEVKMPKDFSCLTCALCKISCKPFNSYRTVLSKSKLEIIHTDICGPMRNVSQGGSVYFITFIDDYTRYMSTYFLKQKSEALSVFKEFKLKAENETGCKVKILRSDNGREYLSSEFDLFLKQNGIVHQTTVAYTPQQNGIAERANRTLVEMGRCMLEESKLPKSLWSEAVNTATYLRNRAPTKVLQGKTPYECWFGWKPSVSHLKAFGCDAVALQKQKNLSKFMPKGRKLIFVGYSNQSKAYRLYDSQRRAIVISRDVKFFENSLTEKSSSQSTPTLASGNEYFTTPVVVSEDGHAREHSQDIVSADVNQNNQPQCIDGESNAMLPSAAGVGGAVNDECAEHSVNDTDVSTSEEAEETNVVGKRKRGRPKINRTGNVGRPRKLFVVEDSTVPEVLNSIVSDPISVREAIESANKEKWREAMKSEYDSLIKNETWDLVDRPDGKNIIGNKWVFSTKRRCDGSVEKYKARLVAQGCFQKRNIDYHETYAPVVRHSTIRLILAIAVQYKLLVNHIDIVSAYLNSTLNEEIYMYQPEMFVQKDQQNKVCKLKKSLYGLKQAGREWNKKFNEILCGIGFRKCLSDNCVYIMKKNEEFIIVALYVDDLMLACSNQSTMSEIIEQLKCFVDVVDRGPISFYLGMEIERDGLRGPITVHQRKYTAELLKAWNMTECKPSSTPFPSGTELEKCTSENCKEIYDVKTYQSLIGGLMYLAVISRPDILHTLSKLSQFNNHPHKQHFIAAKHILRYLKYTANANFTYSRMEKTLSCFTDSDWGSNIVDRKSYSGYIVFLAGGPIAWESKKQNSVSLSSTEAEYVAMCEGAKEIIFYRHLLTELRLTEYCNVATVINSDNQGAEFLVRNPVTKKRSKHIDIKYHYLREKYESNDIDIIYVPSAENVADLLTKCLPKSKHMNCCKLLQLNL